ncbi:hypothetical protein JCM3775_002650 [Rhodotorula graminis]
MYGVPLPTPRASSPPPARSPPRPPRQPTSTPATASSRITELDDGPSPLPTPPKARAPAEPSLLDYLLDHPLALWTDHNRCFDLVATLLLVWEAVLGYGIVGYVNYTEIDFSTYLQQSQAFLAGARDYNLIKGDSGPAYYPALHVYVYSALSWLTNGGNELKRAQWAFAGVYLATLAVVFVGIYRRNERIPPYALVLLTLSKRLHSIYLLRMFNDAVVMLLVYSAIALYMVPAGGTGKGERRGVEMRWMLGTVLLSCALSIKMSALLFLPALFYLAFVHLSPLAALQHLVLLVLPLVLFSSPFLTTREHALTYGAQAFDFARAFDWRYTLNWRFLGEDAFDNPRWGTVLLGAHAAGLVLWAEKWAAEDGGVAVLLRRAARFPGRKPSPAGLSSSRIATVFFLSNLTGVLCARSLHPQFYAWFAWSLPWLVCGGGGGVGAVEGGQGLALLVAIEYGMSVWPSTVNSSLGLVLAMLVLLMRSYYAELPPASPPSSTAQDARGREAQWVVPPRWADTVGDKRE